MLRPLQAVILHMHMSCEETLVLTEQRAGGAERLAAPLWGIGNQLPHLEITASESQGQRVASVLPPHPHRDVCEDGGVEPPKWTEVNTCIFSGSLGKAWVQGPTSCKASRTAECLEGHVGVHLAEGLEGRNKSLDEC
jgi:hypothetical protein